MIVNKPRQKSVLFTLLFCFILNLSAQNQSGTAISVNTAGTDKVLKDLSTVTGVSQVTFECWMKLPANNANWTRLPALNVGAGLIGFTTAGTGKIVFWGGGSNSNYFIFDNAFDGQWHHYAVTVDFAATGDPIPTGSNEAGRKATRMYIDGYNAVTEESEIKSLRGLSSLNLSSIQAPNSYNATEDFGTLVYDVSAWNPGYDYEFDELRVWKTVRTPEEIRNSMNRTDLPELADPNLVLYYKCDSVTNELVDSSTDTDHSTTTSPLTDPSLGRVTSYAHVADASALSGWNAPDSLGINSTSTRSDSGIKFSTPTIASSAYMVETAVNLSTNTSTADLPSGILSRLERQWYVLAAGAVTADLTFDLTGITDPPAEADAKVLYRASDSGNFTALSTSGTISGNEITFTGVSLSTGYYTFGSASTLTPAIGLVVTQTGNTLSWTVENEIDVHSYQVKDDSGNLLDTVTAAGSGLYTVQLPENVKAILIVVDNSGFSKTYIPEDGNIVTERYNLQKGWNLIAFTSDNPDLEPLSGKIVGAIWSWNGSAYQQVTSAQATQAAWIYAPDAVTITVKGDKSDRKINLKSGWNMVGPIKDSYKPEGAEQVFSWNDTYTKISTEYEVLIGGVGYWIFAL